MRLTIPDKYARVLANVLSDCAQQMKEDGDVANRLVFKLAERIEISCDDQGVPEHG